MDLINDFLSKTKLNYNKINELSPLVLAYIGDAVFELFIRVFLVGDGEVKASVLHKRSIEYVKAKAQAQIVKSLDGILTEEESEIIRRARNIKPASPPKNADIMDYRYATGFEALIGHLYLADKSERLMEILELSIKKINGGKAI